MVSLVARFDFSKGLLLTTFRESVYNCCKCPKRNRCRRLVMMVAVVSVLVRFLPFVVDCWIVLLAIV